MFLFRNLKKVHWRYYFFEVENENFCFDCFTHKIFKINNEIATSLKNKQYALLMKNYKIFYKSVVLAKPFKAEKAYDNKCRITINYSNNCNLNCTYCYRDKADTTRLSREATRNIVDYIVKKYMPNASEYVFSLGYSSESSLDLEYLKFFDSLLAEYEKNYFVETSFKNNSSEIVYEQLPEEIKKRHRKDKGKTVIELLNEVLKTEQLWLYYTTYRDWIKQVLSKTNELSTSKAIRINRYILNDNYPNLLDTRDPAYFTLSFMTNATLITDEYINFIKSICMDYISVSIDGPKEVNDKYRKYYDGKGTYDDIIVGIKKLISAGIKVDASVVVQPENPCLYEIILFLKDLGVHKIIFSLPRGKNVSPLTKTQIIELLNNYNKIYNRIYEDLTNGKTDFILMIKDSFLMDTIKILYSRKYKVDRCLWGREAVINTSGDFYHCNNTVGIKEDFIGNISTEIRVKDIRDNKNVNNSKRCQKCWAKYLCGGLCYYEEMIQNETTLENKCAYKKSLIEKQIQFYAKLQKEDLLKTLIKIIEGTE